MRPAECRDGAECILRILQCHHWPEFHAGLPVRTRPNSMHVLYFWCQLCCTGHWDRPAFGGFEAFLVYFFFFFYFISNYYIIFNIFTFELILFKNSRYNLKEKSDRRKKAYLAISLGICSLYSALAMLATKSAYSKPNM